MGSLRLGIEVCLAACLALAGACALAQNSAGDSRPVQQSAKDAPPPKSASQPAAGASSSEAQPKHSTAEDNPFPEDISKKAAAAATDSHSPNADAPGDSSSRTGAESLDLDDTKNKESRTQLKLTEPETGRPYDPKLAADDDRIAEFYLKNGDYPGAYARFREASEANPGDARAVFGLAESARKMNKTKEALENYEIYLEAFPDGPKAKAARKALSELKIPVPKP